MTIEIDKNEHQVKTHLLRFIGIYLHELFHLEFQKCFCYFPSKHLEYELGSDALTCIQNFLEPLNKKILNQNHTTLLQIIKFFDRPLYFSCL